MAMIRYRTLTDVCGSSSASVSSTTQSLVIPRDTYIRAINIEQYEAVNASSTPTVNQDNPMSHITNVRLVAGGNDTLVSTPMAQLVYYTQYEAGGGCVRQKQGTGTGASTLRAFARIDFSLIPKAKLGDLTACLPAHLLSSLSLFATYGADSTLATNTSTTASFLRVTLEEVIMTPEEQRALYGNNLEKLLKCYYIANEKTIDATYTESSFNWDMPTGGIVQKMLITAINNSVRSDSIVSSFKITKEGPTAYDIYQSEWYSNQEMDTFEYGLDSYLATYNGEAAGTPGRIVGVNMIDFSASTISVVGGNVVGGLDCRGLKSGDVKYRHTNGSPTSTAKMVFLTKEIKQFR